MRITFALSLLLIMAGCSYYEINHAVEAPFRSVRSLGIKARIIDADELFSGLLSNEGVVFFELTHTPNPCVTVVPLDVDYPNEGLKSRNHCIDSIYPFVYTDKKMIVAIVLPEGDYALSSYSKSLGKSLTLGSYRLLPYPIKDSSDLEVNEKYSMYTFSVSPEDASFIAYGSEQQISEMSILDIRTIKAKLADKINFKIQPFKYIPYSYLGEGLFMPLPLLEGHNIHKIPNFIAQSEK